MYDVKKLLSRSDINMGIILGNTMICNNEGCYSKKLCERHMMLPYKLQPCETLGGVDGTMCPDFINMEGKNCTPHEIHMKVLMIHDRENSNKTYIEWLEDFYIKNHQRGVNI